jgi:UDP-GlcNAc:undecaprenyl-phosphate GlcNAc-1-phosphate transferase
MRLITGWENAIPLMVAAFLAAGLATLLLTPLVRRLAHRYNVLDRPDPRRVNLDPVPRGGGIAIMSAFIAVAIGATLVNGQLHLIPMPDTIGAPEMTALLVGGFAAAALGAMDDYLQLRARWQGIGQVVLAVAVVVLGVGVEFIQNPFGPGLLILDGLAGAFTVFWIIGMVNSINWIDGLDGLSSGVGLIAAATLGVISLSTAVGQPYVAVLCFALAGALLGFLRWNFHPASIFMGTSGTMFVGFTLAVLSILGTAKVAVAVLVLGVPIIDTFWIIVRRVASRRSPFTPDRGHIHHRLLDLGLSHMQTVLLIYGICAGLALLSFVLSGTAQLYAFGIFVGVSGLILYVLTRRAGGIPPSNAERRRGAHPVAPPVAPPAAQGREKATAIGRDSPA